MLSFTVAFNSLSSAATTFTVLSDIKRMDAFKKAFNAYIFIRKAKLLRYFTYFIKFGANNLDTRPQKTFKFQLQTRETSFLYY